MAVFLWKAIKRILVSSHIHHCLYTVITNSMNVRIPKLKYRDASGKWCSVSTVGTINMSRKVNADIDTVSTGVVFFSSWRTFLFAFPLHFKVSFVWILVSCRIIMTKEDSTIPFYLVWVCYALLFLFRLPPVIRTSVSSSLHVWLTGWLLN